MRKMRMKAIEFAEKNFECIDGPQMAWFTPDGFDDRLTYVVYAAAGGSDDALNKWLIDNVLKPLLALGGKRLYWRLEYKVKEYMEYPATEDKETGTKAEDFPDLPIYGGVHRIYTRIVVLDDDNNPITIDDEIKLEGECMKELAA